MTKEIRPESAENDSTDLYKILPRFLSNPGHHSEGKVPKPIKRTVYLNGEAFQFFILPAAVAGETGEDGQDNYFFPEVPEALTESIIIELATEDGNFSFDGDKKFAFKLKQIQNRLTVHGFRFSRQQIERSIHILAGATYVMIGENTEWIFRTIETLAATDEGTDTQFLVFLGDVTSQRIRALKIHQSQNYEEST